MIETHQLTHTYGSRQVLRGVNLRLSNGKIYGIYGEKATGKSTLLALLSGAMEVQEGEIRINGFDLSREPISAKKCVGYLPEELPLYPDMTAFELLSFVASARGVDPERRFLQVHEALEVFGLDSLRGCLIGNMTPYQLRRLALAQTVPGGTEILLLDCPTRGLSKKEAAELNDRILWLNEKGKTVFYASDSPAELAELCDEILLLQDGVLSSPVPTSELLQGRLLRLCAKGERAEILDLLSTVGGLLSCSVLSSEAEETVCLLRTINGESEKEISLAMENAKIPLLSCQEQAPTGAEAAFLAGAAGALVREKHREEEH